MQRPAIPPDLLSESRQSSAETVQSLAQSNRANEFLLASSRILAEVGRHHTEALQRLAEFTSDYMDAVCNISVLHPGEDVIRPIALHHADERVTNAIKEAFANTIVTAGEGMVGKVIAEGIEIVQFSAAKDLREVTARFNPLIVPESFMYLPLQTARGVLGAINMVRLEGRPAFTQDDVDLIRRLASHTALFLDNAWLYEAQTAELELRTKTQEALQRANEVSNFLLNVSWLLSDLQADRNQALLKLTKAVALHFNVFCVVYLSDVDGVKLRPRAYYHGDRMVRDALKRVFDSEILENGLRAAKSVSAKGRPFIVRNASDMDVDSARMEPLLEPLAVGFWPLKGRESIGAICLCRLQGTSIFSDDELERAEQLARHLSMFLENMLLHDRQQREIARRQEAEQRLARNEDDLRTILNAIPINISRVSKDFRYKFLNESYRSMGMTPESLIGRHIIDLLGQEGLERIMPKLERVLKGELLNYDEHLTLANGLERHFNVVIAPDIDRDGNVQGFYSCTVDTTAKVEAERELRLSEERYRSLLLHSGDAFCLHKLSGEILDINAFATAILGYSREELLTMNISSIDLGWLSPDYPRRLASILPDVPITFDTRILHKDGHEVPVEVRFVKRVEQGEVLIQALVRDRTEKRQREERLRQSEERLRILVENVDDVIMTVDYNGVIQSVNKPKQGHTRDDVVGKSIFALMSSGEKARVSNELAAAQKSGKSFELLSRHTGPDGTAEWYLTNYCPVEGEQILVAVSRNITYMKEANLQVMNGMTVGQEQERRRLGAELHDGVGQILSSISLELSQIKDSSACNDKVRAQMEELGSRISEAINEVRNISHDLMPGVLESFGLSDAIREVCRNMRGREDITITCDLVDMSPSYPDAVETHLYRIAQELINNCVRHAHCTRVHVNLIDYGDSITLSVEDDGLGFDIEKPVNGIGLRNARSRASILGGTLSVESSGTSGTLVLVDIPKYQEDGNSKGLGGR